MHDRRVVPAHGLSRRGLLRAAGAAAAAGVAAGALRGPRAAAASPNTAHTVLVLRPGIPNNPVAIEVYQRALAPFRRRNPSLDIQLNFTYLGNPGGLISDILAGQAPDVFENFRYAAVSSGGYLLDLTPYVRSSNLNLSVFSSSLVQYFTHDGRLHALPFSNEWTACMVNLSMLDQAGLKYPEPNWNYQQAEELYRAVAKPSSDPTKAVYGGFFWMYYSNTPSAFYLAPWGGAIVDPQNQAHCTADSPQTVAAVSYMADLIGSGACLWDNALGQTHFKAGKLAVALASDWTLVSIASMAPTLGFEFDFWPMPAGPVGGATYASHAYYAIPANTKEPDAAWSLLEYVATEPYVARVWLDLFLYPPPTVTLGEEYLATIRRVAPPLRNKNLEAFIYWKDHAVQPPFAYQDPQAETIISNYFGKIWTKQMAPQEALSIATKQVNALEAVGAAAAARAEAALLQVDKMTHATGPVSLPPPPKRGIGVAAVAAPQLAVIQRPQGVYTLLGDGLDVWNTSDNCVYACAPVPSSDGTFICRVTAISNLTCPSLSPWVKVGLMARGDLSDDAAMVFLGVTGGNGIALAARPVAAVTPGIENGDGGHTGLMAAQYVTSNPAKPAANYLLQPIWLKLQRQGLMWTAYTSLDGSHWTVGGAPQAVEMGSAWIGVFACAQNGDFNGKGYIRATFDHLNFTPSGVYQVGQAGVPPAAGAVPTNWATMTAS